MSLSLSRLGDDIALKFKELQVQSLSTEEFWKQLAEFTMKRIDTLREINAKSSEPQG